MAKTKSNNVIVANRVHFTDSEVQELARQIQELTGFDTSTAVKAVFRRYAQHYIDWLTSDPNTQLHQSPVAPLTQATTAAVTEKVEATPQSGQQLNSEDVLPPLSVADLNQW